MQLALKVFSGAMSLVPQRSPCWGFAFGEVKTQQKKTETSNLRLRLLEEAEVSLELQDYPCVHFSVEAHTFLPKICVVISSRLACFSTAPDSGMGAPDPKPRQCTVSRPVALLETRAELGQ